MSPRGVEMLDDYRSDVDTCDSDVLSVRSDSSVVSHDSTSSSTITVIAGSDPLSVPRALQIVSTRAPVPPVQVVSTQGRVPPPAPVDSLAGTSVVIYEPKVSRDDVALLVELDALCFGPTSYTFDTFSQMVEAIIGRRNVVAVCAWAPAPAGDAHSAWSYSHPQWSLVGFISCCLANGSRNMESGRLTCEVHIISISVHPSYRGRGVAQQLLDQGIEQAMALADWSCVPPPEDSPATTQPPPGPVAIGGFRAAGMRQRPPSQQRAAPRVPLPYQDTNAVWQVITVQLECRTDNFAALRFYVRQHFDVVRIVRNYYRQQPQEQPDDAMSSAAAAAFPRSPDAYVMRRDLRAYPIQQ